MIRAAEKTEAEKIRSRGIQDLSLGRSDLFRFDPRALRIEPSWNSRSVDFDPEDAEDLALARSIAEVGVKQALTVTMKDGAPTLTDGHRRLKATLYAIDVLGAEIASIPVQTEPKHATEADRVLSQIVRNSGKPLEPIEKASVFAKLMDLGWTEITIAAKVGLTRQRVVDLLTLRSGPQAVVDMVKAGEISAGFALDEIRAAKGDDEVVVKRLTIAKETAKASGKSRATAKHVERVAPDLTKHPAYAAGLRRAVELAREHLSTKDDDGETGEVYIVRKIVGEIEAEIRG